MPRPCKELHELSPDNCRLCYWCLDLSETGAAYRAAWDEPEPAGYIPPRRKVTGDCVHLGRATGELADCAEACGKGWRFKTFACAIYGSTTKDKRGVDVPGCCKGCPSYVAQPLGDFPGTGADP